MDYIAVIDYDHLDNGIFLSSLARALAGQKESRGLLIHGESEYTERLIQTGMMREDAAVRAIKDLNHRLIALFADYGVSAVGINGYQRSLVRKTENSIEIDTLQFERLPQETHILLSSLVEHHNQIQPAPATLDNYALALSNTLKIEDIFVFLLDDSEDIIRKEEPAKIYKNQLDKGFIESQIPREFRDTPCSFRLISTPVFANYPSKKGGTLIV